MTSKGKNRKQGFEDGAESSDASTTSFKKRNLRKSSSRKSNTASSAVDSLDECDNNVNRYLSSSIGSASIDLRPNPKTAQGLRRFGVRIVYDPGPKAIVDILCIHGLNGHSIDSWTLKTQDSEIFWLNDYLPGKFPEARILTYGYDGQTSGSEELSQQSISDIGSDLLTKFALFRDNPPAKRRKIIFIAHSVGGIILKCALVNSAMANSQHNHDHHFVHQSTSGIVFLGTPHQGTEGTPWSGILPSIDTLSQTVKVRTLEDLGRESSFLHATSIHFTAIAWCYTIAFVYETRASELPGGRWSMIVPRGSAVLAGHRNAQIICRYTDHMGLAKFTSEDDDGFPEIVSLLRGMAQKELQHNTPSPDPITVRPESNFEASLSAEAFQRHPEHCDLSPAGISLRPAAEALGILQIIKDVTSNDTTLNKTLSAIQHRLASLLPTFNASAQSNTAPAAEQFARSLMKSLKKIQAMELNGEFVAPMDSEQVTDQFQALLFHMNQATQDLQVSLVLSIHRNVKLVLDSSKRQRLDGLLCHEAMFESNSHQKGCTPGTRLGILRMIQVWATSQSGQNIFWLAGAAGTGKSAIAHSIADMFQSSNKIIPSFFCSRQFTSARMRRNIVPMIASLLARISQPFQDALLECDWGPLIARPNAHVQHFLVEPWQAAERLEGCPPMLVVIDALDELEDEDGECAGAMWIKELIRHADDLHGLKFLITSRYDRELVQHCQDINYSFHLAEIEAVEANYDISLYLTQALPTTFPVGSKHLNAIVEQSAGLFIYAVTVVRLIKPLRSPALQQKQLEKLSLALKPLGSDSLAIDSVYTQVLGCLAPGSSVFREQILYILWAVLCAQEPLKPSTLATLIPDVAQDTVEEAVGELHAVLYTNADGCILTYHKSFPDFMVDSKRCHSDFLYVPHVYHEILVCSSFRIMQSELRFNICNLPSSFLLDQDVDGLEQQVADQISSPLCYSCKYWPVHLLESSKGSCHSAVELLCNFMDEHLLFWIEVMNLIHHSGECAEMLMSILDSIVMDSTLRDNLIVAERLASSFSTHAVRNSTPHLYLSTLAATNPNHPFIQRWRKKFPGIPSLNGTRRHEQLVSTFVLGAEVYDLALSPNGKHVACGLGDGRVVVWDWRRGQQIFEICGQDCSIFALSFSPSGAHLALGGKDGVVQIWDVHTYRQLHNLHTSSTYIYSVAYSPQGDLLASGTDDSSIQVWDMVSRKERFQLEGHSDCVESVAFSPNGTRLASGSLDKTIMLWDMMKGTRLTIFQGHTAYVLMVSFSPDGEYIVSGSQDQSVRLWKVTDGTEERKFVHDEQIYTCVFSPDGTRVASGGDDKQVYVWDLKSGRREVLFEGRSKGMQTVIFSLDGRFLISGSKDETMQVWNVGMTNSIQSGTLLGHSDAVLSVAYSPDGDHIISCCQDGTVCVWDALHGNEVRNPEVLNHPVNCASCSPNGRFFVFASDDGMVSVQDFEAGTQQLRMDVGKGLLCVGISPDGKQILAGFKNGNVELWNTTNGTHTQTLRGHTGRVQACCFSPDGLKMMSCDDDRMIRVWNATTGEEELLILGQWPSVIGAAFSPDSQKIVSRSSESLVQVWNANNGENLLELKCNADQGFTTIFLVHIIIFSPDGKQILSGILDGTIRVWDAVTGQQLLRQDHIWGVTSTSFSHDGTRIVIGLEDGAVFVWNTALGQQLQQSCNQWIISDDSTWSVSKDGWILSQDGQQLMWLSPADHAILKTPGCDLRISRMGTLYFAPSTVPVGDEWSKIYQSSSAV